MQRILSISGLRGIVGDGLDPNFVVKFSQALGILAGRGTVVVGRDGRATGMMLKRAVQAGLESVGCRVIDVGITATPTCGFLVRHLGAAGGIEITASHNPIEWNGLKPFSSDGSVFDEEAGRRLLELLEPTVGNWPLETTWTHGGAAGRRARRISTRVLELVDVKAIRARRLKVVLDATMDPGALLGPKLLEALGCQVTVWAGRPTANSSIRPEPLKENLIGLCEAVRRRGPTWASRKTRMPIGWRWWTTGADTSARN